MRNKYPLIIPFAGRILGAMVTLMIFIGQTNAQCDQMIVSDTLSAEYTGSPVDFCVDLDYIIAIRADRYLDGVLQTAFPVGCDFDSLIYYPYTTLPGVGNVGPYDLELWTVDGAFLSVPFTNIDDLVDQMNVFDANGIWINEIFTRNIVGGVSGRDYGAMTIEQQSSGIRRTINPNISSVANGTLVTADGAGFHEYVVDDPSTGCRDTITLFLNPVIDDDVFDVFTAYNEESDVTCLDNTELLGIPQAATICDTPDNGILTDQGGYCYTYTPTVGHVGSDVVCFEVCDDTPTPLGPLCKRTFINFITESPTNINRDTLRFQMTNTDTLVCVNALLDLGVAADGASLCGPVPSGLSIIPYANGCVDISPDATFSGPATVCVRHCIGVICDTTILEFTVIDACDLDVFDNDVETITSQGNPTSFCIPVDPALLGTYTLTVDGQVYAGPTTDCNIEQQFFYNYAPLFGNGNMGPYTLTRWVIDGAIFTTTFQNPTELLAFMRAADPAGDWQLDTTAFDLIGGLTTSSYAPMEIVHNATGTRSNLQPNPIDIAGGSTIDLPGDGTYEIEISDPASGCTDLVIVTVGQAPTTTTQSIEVIVFVDSVSENTCLFTNPRDTFSLCGDVNNGTTTFDLNNCVIYEPNPGFLGLDTLCVVSCDLPGGTVCDTTFVIFRVEPRTTEPNPRDTVFLTNFGDAPFNLCNGLPISGPFSDVSICGVTGPFTAVVNPEGNCVVADPTNGVAGTGEICVTFCSTDTPPSCQDIVFIITQTPSCAPALFSQDTVVLGPSVGDVDYCLANGSDLSDYEVYVNGTFTIPTTDPNCGTTGGGGGQTVHFYPLLFINDGPLRIDGWDIGGNVILNVSTTGFNQLADTMSALDPGNDWTYDAAEQGLVATSNLGNYSDLILFDLTFGTTYQIPLEPLQQGGGGGGGTGAGSVITIPQQGVYNIEVIALDGSCGDRLVIYRQGFAAPDRDTVAFSAFADQLNGPFCLDVNELGAAATSIQSCGDPANGTISYTSFECLNYQPDPGFVGSDSACVVICTNGGLLCDTTIVIFNVAPGNSCPEIWNEAIASITTDDCTATVNVCLPAFPDEFFNYTISVDGVVQSGALACGADTVTIYSYADVAGQGQAGPYRVEGYTLTSGTYTNDVDNVSALVDSLNQWDPNGNWMLNPSNFTIFGGVSGFAYDTINFRQIATDTLNRLVPVTTLIENQLGVDLPVGSYSVSVTDNRTNCTDTLRYDVICTTGNDCLDLTAANGTELTLVDCSGTTEFEVLSPTTDPSELTVYVDGILVPVTVNAGSVIVLLAEGMFEVVVVDPIQSCASTFMVSVVCGPCPGPLPSDTIGAGVDCSSNELEICLPAPPDVLQAYAITIDGLPYTGTLGDCNAVQTLVLDIFELPDGGAVGPYTIDSFRINGQLFSANVSSMQALADTLDVWDTTGSWRYDAAELLILGGNPQTTYSNLFVTQIATSTQAQVALMQEVLALGTVITITPGAATRILTFDNGIDCIQEVSLTIPCTTNSTASDTIPVTGSTVFCFDESELSGPIVSLENVCPDPSGAAIFDFGGQLGCVTVTGVSAGSVTACLVACDALGVCDTTFYTVVVTPDGSGGIDAVDDELRLRTDQSGMISVTANDTFNGALSTITLVAQPRRGIALLDADGTLSYTPQAGECGFTDSLVYQICQGALCDRALVLVHVRCEPVEAFNGFSPNGDGINDQFRFTGIEDFPENTLTVYNRWGNEVLVAPNYQNDWEGTWDGKVLIDGTYFWQLEIEGQEPLTGYVQIHR